MDILITVLIILAWLVIGFIVSVCAVIVDCKYLCYVDIDDYLARGFSLYTYIGLILLWPLGLIFIFWVLSSEKHPLKCYVSFIVKKFCKKKVQEGWLGDRDESDPTYEIGLPIKLNENKAVANDDSSRSDI